MSYQVIGVNVRDPQGSKGSAISSEAISPGHFVENVAAGTIRKNQRVAAGTVPRRIAVHNAEEGKTISDVWASGSRVKYQDFLPGDEVQVFLKAGVSGDVEQLVRFDNTGCVTTAGTNAPAGHLLEALDLTASGAVDTLARVRLL